MSRGLRLTESEVQQFARRVKEVMPSVPAESSGDSAHGGVTHPPKSTSKYHNTRCQWNGEWFDSIAELEWWRLLVARQELGEISGLRRQVPFRLYAPMMLDGESNGIVEVARYVADAVYFENGQKIIADRKSKGTRTAMFKLKAKWLTLQSGLVITEVL